MTFYRHVVMYVSWRGTTYRLSRLVTEAEFMNLQSRCGFWEIWEFSDLRFLYGFLSSFLLYRNCKRLREFEEIDISSKIVRWLWITRWQTLKIFVWISSKNLVSGLWAAAYPDRKAQLEQSGSRGMADSSGLRRTLHHSHQHRGVLDHRQNHSW